ncbi:hypothetical protein [Longispora fulva]|uniref:Uncharacterized protein n=1 Tax=Longispora fulva TaxID=619741 RepID=A0A8J7GF09_9ACTN|nr:hypothetical protein [Longispora fulva]MBG6135337.1 hypothetical protein [Longispora fulva]
MSEPEPYDLDLRVDLPDGVTAREWGNDLLMRAEGGGAFVRVLLPVRLRGGSTITFSTWLRVSEEDLHRAFLVWAKPGYGELVLDGTLANTILPWGPAVLGAPATAAVLDPAHLPTLVESSNPTLLEVLGLEWDADDTLSRMGCAVPVPVRQPVTDRWEFERTAGLAPVQTAEGLRFVGPGRTVIVDVLTTPEDWEPEYTLETMLKGAPADPEGRLLEGGDGGLRHALWQESADGREFYGHVVRRGTAAHVICLYADPDDLAWALEVWRSVTARSTGA